jgi:MFS family permease
VSLLAACGAVVQPWTGRVRDAGRIRDGVGMATGLGLAAAGMVLAALVPGVAGVLGAAMLIGVGTGLVSPLGFAHLAGTTPTERLGQTLGSAEVGRELGDAGGPLLVGAIATAATLGTGLLGLAAILAGLGATVAAAATPQAHDGPSLAEEARRRRDPRRQ